MLRLLLIVFHEQIVGGAFQNITDGFQVLELDGAGFVFQDPFEVLITQIQLHIKPIAGLSFFFQDLVNTKMHGHYLHTLDNAHILFQKFA